MAEELVFYFNPMSRARIVRWMIEETGAPYRAEMVEFGPAMKSPEYLAVNPMGKVPAIRHGKTIITECAAICAYLADAFPAARLAPPVSDRGDYYRWLFFAAGPLEAAVSNNALGLQVPADKQGMIGYGTYKAVMDTLEQAVKGKRHIAGEHFSAADVYVGAHIGWGLQFGSIEKRPAFVEYHKHVSDRPAARRAAELDDAAMPKKSA